MSELVFMPTPNWFTSNPIAICETDNSIAITAINSILFTSNLFLNFDGYIKDAHTKRINGVSFHVIKNENKTSKLLATCSEDFDIKVWNVESKSLYCQHKLHQNSPSCLAWMSLETNNIRDSFLISCDVKGNIYKWSLNTNEHFRYFPENKPITQVKSCKSHNLIAVGYKQGTICILDITEDQMKIMFKLKNHEDTINCLCWFPVDSLGIDQAEITRMQSVLNVEKLNMVLCSSSEDKTIRLWDSLKGTELKCIKSPGTSSNSLSKKNNQFQAVAKINYTPLCWPSPQYIVTGSFKGDLHFFDLFEENNQNTKWRFFTSLNSEKGHKKTIYDISCSGNYLISLSLDRLINIWNMKNFKQEQSLTTLNGYVYSLANSPIDPNILAISVGDSSIKVINQKENSKYAKSFSNKVNSEVTQICWHPTKESIIAFGTKDGKVGIVDIISTNKQAQYIYTSYNQSVYTLLWSEPMLNEEKLTNDNGSKKNNYFHLYSVSDGKLMQHQVNFLNSGSSMIVNAEIQTKNFYKDLMTLTDQEELEKLDHIKLKSNNDFGVTEFSILKIECNNSDENYHYFAIGKFDGSIEIYRAFPRDNYIAKVCTFFNHQKLITILKWNKSTFVIEENTEANSDLFLASGSNDFNVIIVDFKNIINEFEKKMISKDSKFFSKYAYKLVGHKERITGLSWSTNNLLASCSFDSTVQIWNANNGKPIANYRGHSEKLLCCLFSNLDSNLVYSGGEDYCLHKWKIDAQSEIMPPEECSLLIGKKKNKVFKKARATKKQESNDQASYKQNEIADVDELKNYESDKEMTSMISSPSKNTELKTNSNEELHDLESSERLVGNQLKITNKKMIKLGSNQRGEIKSLFLLSSHGGKSQTLKLQDCLKLFETLYEKYISSKNFDPKEIHADFELEKLEFSSEHLNLCLFGNRFSTLGMIKCEQAELKRLSFDKWWIFEAWRGNILKMFNDFKQQNNLDDLLLSLYHISIDSNNKNLVDPLKTYIDQLSNGTLDQINKAVLFALASYDVKKAIDIYLKNNLFQYALCLAHLRLMPNSPLLQEVLSRYAFFANSSGDYETAVMCYIRLGDFENGFKCLIRRNCKNDLENENLIKKILEKFSLFMPELNINFTQ